MKRSFVSLAVLLVVCIGIVAGTPKVAHAKTTVYGLEAADYTLWYLLDGNENFIAVDEYGVYDVYNAYGYGYWSLIYSYEDGDGLTGKIAIKEDKNGGITQITLSLIAKGVTPSEDGKSVVWDWSTYGEFEIPFGGIVYLTSNWKMTISPSGSIKVTATWRSP